MTYNTPGVAGIGGWRVRKEVCIMKAHILVIDDDRHISEVLRRALAYEGYTVDYAYRGNEGLQKTLEHPPDLIILDLMLPGMDGIEVCRRLRASGNQVPIHADCKGCHCRSRRGA